MHVSSRSDGRAFGPGMEVVMGRRKREVGTREWLAEHVVEGKRRAWFRRVDGASRPAVWRVVAGKFVRQRRYGEFLATTKSE